MKRSGFTMIELIFVIVILGILAAVAIPKMVGVQEQARAAKAGELVSQLNSVVVPQLWAKAQMANDGDVGAWLTAAKTANASDPKITLAYYTEIPSNFAVANTDLTTVFSNAACQPDDTTPVVACQVLSDASNSIYIFARDGNLTDSPRFWYSTKSAGVANDFNVSKSTF